jgi:hypothetical protein
MINRLLIEACMGPCSMSPAVMVAQQTAAGCALQWRSPCDSLEALAATLPQAHKLPVPSNSPVRLAPGSPQPLAFNVSCMRCAGGHAMLL